MTDYCDKRFKVARASRVNGASATPPARCAHKWIEMESRECDHPALGVGGMAAN